MKLEKLAILTMCFLLVLILWLHISTTNANNKSLETLDRIERMLGVR